jgi:hypothetical protein
VSYAPDGTAIVFSKEDSSGAKEQWGDLFIVDLAADRVLRLTSDGRSTKPVWGGSWIAFSRLHDLEPLGAVSELYLLHPDGSGAHRLTIDEETVCDCGNDGLRFGLVPERFSADGKRLLACVEIAIEVGGCEPVAFTVPSGPGAKLWTIEKDAPETIWSSDLSSDGRYVLVEGGTFVDEWRHWIATIPFGGGEPQVLLRNAELNSWAPVIPQRGATATTR